MARTALDAFIAEYARYVQIAVRRRAQTVRTLHSTYEETMRRLRAAEADHEAAGRAIKALEERKLTLDIEEAAARSEITTLEESPEMRGRNALERATREAAEWRERANTATADHGAAVTSHERRRARHAEAVDAANESGGRVSLHSSGAESAARTADLLPFWTAAATALHLPDGPEDLSTQTRVQRWLGDEIDRRRKAVDHVKQLSRAVEKGRGEVAHQDHARLVGEHEDALEAERSEAAALGSASQALISAFRRFRTSLVELRLPDTPEDSEAALSTWCESLAGPNPIGDVVRRGYEEHPALDRRAGGARSERKEDLRRDRCSRRGGARSGSGRTRRRRRRTPAIRRRASSAPALLFGHCAISPAISTRARGRELEAALETSGSSMHG